MDGDGVDRRHIRCPEQSKRAVLDLRDPFLDREPLGQRVTETHDDTAVDLSIAGKGVDYLSHIAGCGDAFHLPRLIVQSDHLGGIGVGDMADRVGFGRSERIGLAEKFPEEFLALELVELMAVHRLLQPFGGTPGSFAAEDRLAACRAGAAIGGASSSKRPHP